MSTMEYIQLRDRLLMKLLKTKDESILKRIEKAFNNDEEEKDFVDELPPYAKKQLLKSIEQSKRGETISFEEMMKELE